MATPEQIQALTEFRGGDDYKDIAPYLTPDEHARLHEIIGEQDADVNKGTPWQNKLFASTKQKTFAPTETNIFGEIGDRPRAVVAAGLADLAMPFTHDKPVGVQEAWQNPRSVKDLGQSQEEAYTKWARQNLPEPLAVAGDVLRQPIGWASSIISNPINAVPLGPGERALAQGGIHDTGSESSGRCDGAICSEDRAYIYCSHTLDR